MPTIGVMVPGSTTCRGLTVTLIATAAVVILARGNVAVGSPSGEDHQRVGGFECPDDVQAVVISDWLAFIACGYAGLVVVEVINALDPNDVNFVLLPTACREEMLSARDQSSVTWIHAMVFDD